MRARLPGGVYSLGHWQGSKLYIDPQECIDCGACEPACPVEAIYHEYDIPTPWVPYIDIDALWFRDPDAARARVAALKEGGKGAQPHDP